ncbi:ABC transporter substrate-binding protein [Flaviaesturariibacter aridisoli]|uniref:Amino acid ABC transporter substrate-binding protein n=1 Tax=Flaviaesturariibacter aridisoli TaxID=2545761 RepID=A0A4R4DYN9_9BACT|nr:ABC transporter substrate-binding protein [Flaviaesturariibacter aridisoli]TCZ70578.1 amino acid ABC transporter substrate-binding protein [Flaviaesturariibacter aridisoli]
MKRIPILFFTLLCSLSLFAQKRHKIALVTPLYLDSAFDASNNYRFNTSFPKYLNPGLEFYLGAQAALDSLNKAGAPLDVYVVDSRSKHGLAQELKAPELRDAELFIGSTNATETRLLAEEALRRKVPFISTTLPNDAGVSDNPYYVVLNSTLRSHCEALYKYYQRTAPNERILLFTRPGTQETQVKEYFADIAKTATGTPLRIVVEDLGAEFNDERVLSALDSTKRNICITGSLDEEFASELAAGLGSAGKEYRIQLAGMPTWEGFNLRQTEFRGLDILYTTPFYYARATPLQAAVGKSFTAKQNGRPTDLYFRGYETTLRFALLLLDTRGDAASNLSRKGNNVFTQFDVQPVFLNHKEPTLDYFENKHLYLVKVTNGTRSVLP